MIAGPAAVACGDFDFFCQLQAALVVWLEAHWLFIALGLLALFLIVLGGWKLKVVGGVIAALLIVWFVTGIPQLGIAPHRFLIDVAAVVRRKVAEISEDPEGQLYVENEEEVVAVKTPTVKPSGSVIVRRHVRNKPRGKERRLDE